MRRSITAVSTWPLATLPAVLNLPNVCQAFALAVDKAKGAKAWITMVGSAGAHLRQVTSSASSFLMALQLIWRRLLPVKLLPMRDKIQKRTNLSVPRFSLPLTSGVKRRIVLFATAGQFLQVTLPKYR